VDEIPRGNSFCAHAILQSDVLIVPDPVLREYDTDVLEKPFLPSELLRKVDDIINQGKDATGTE
jgi:hypothetical protein